MHRPLSLLILGVSGEDIAPVETRLQNRSALTLSTHVMEPGQPSPFTTGERPEALVLAVGDDWQQSLETLVKGLPSPHPPFVVVGPQFDVALLRTAMRAGARDAIAMPFDSDEFLSALAQIASEERKRVGTPSSRIISFINAKGGSGASFIAANVALAIASVQQGRTLVVDMDFQFGSLPTYVDLPATNGLIKALELVESLDEDALRGYVQTHKSGLELLAAAMDDLVLPDDVSEERVRRLIHTLDGPYRYIVFDLPRRIDSSTATALMQSDEIIVVTQQTLSHLHDAKRLIKLLQNHLGVTAERLRLIINRYDKRAEVRLHDFSSVLVGSMVETMPNDYPHVAESINLGIPLYQRSPRSALGKRLAELATSIATGKAPAEDKQASGLLSWLKRSG